MTVLRSSLQAGGDAGEHMELIMRIALIAIGLATLGLVAPIAANAQSNGNTSARTVAPQQQPSTAKQRTGDGDTGHGDRSGALASKQRTGDGDIGYGDRATKVSKQRTADGDTGAGDRPTPFGSGRSNATTR